jgi:hypothetical protein
VQVFKGTEPVDLIVLDEATHPTTVFFSEIKASPLVTLPLATESQRLVDETQTITHQATSHTALWGSSLMMLMPTPHTEGWRSALVPIGSKKDADDLEWAYRGFVELLEADRTFFERYHQFWIDALACYGESTPSSPNFWLTNGCGQPSPRPAAWPKRIAGTGYESVSDGKTSVGMDRTDDIKKATYQMLKLGAEGRPSAKYDYKVGLVSNIHAVRHFTDYVEPVNDIVWTFDESGKVRNAQDLPPHTPLYNLFDGVVALTAVTARDQWVRTLFSF